MIHPAFMSISTLIALVLSATLSARGEVRARAGGTASGPIVSVHLTRSGPWAPVGPLDASVLNPAGDILGHGLPGLASDGDTAAAGWFLPGGEWVDVASFAGGAWTPARGIPAQEGRGIPRLALVDGQVAVAWQEARTGCSRVMLAASGSDVHAPCEIVEAGSGLLLDAIQVGRAFHLLRFEPENGVLLDTFLMTVVFPTDPIDFLRQGEFLVDGLASPRKGKADVEARAAAELIGSRPALHVLRLPHGASTAVLTWWSSPQALRHVELTEYGPSLPVEELSHSGAVEWPNSLLQRALNQVRCRSR